MNIVLSEVSKVFGTGARALPALAPLSLTIETGSLVGIIGPSGCGKSTLLRLVADQIVPSTGTILLDGAPPTTARRRKAIGWMAQNPALLPWRTVLDNVRLPLMVNHQHGRAALAPAELLAMVGLADFADAYPGILSGGMQQRVALARTLVTGAPLWLMDEPFAALDELTREVLADEVLELWGRFRPTVLWVTHNIGEAVRLADRVVVMTDRPGRIRATVDVPLPRPRDDTTPEAATIIRRLRALLKDGDGRLERGDSASRLPTRLRA